MQYDHFVDQVFTLAKQASFSEYELYFENTDSLQLQAFEGEIIKFSSSDTQGINFRGIFEGQVGSAYSEVLDEETAELLVQKAKIAASLTEVEDTVFIFGKKEEYPQLDLVHPSLAKAGTQKKLDLVLKNEETALSSGQIDKVSSSAYADASTHRRMINSQGLNVSFDRNHAYAYLDVLASDRDGTYSALAYEINHDFASLAKAPLSQEAVNKVKAKKGARPVSTGHYPIVFENTAAASLLAAHMSAFSAEQAQKGMSLLKNKVGEDMASPAVNLVDNPLLSGGSASAPFDGEGVPTFSKHLIEKGRLLTLLHNLKTAHKEKVATTANASRESYKANIGVSNTNTYLEKGPYSKEEVLKEVDEGLYITELDGLHAGTNAISGDFSLGVRGFAIENGTLGRPVNQIVLSGNFFTLIKEVTMVADDLRFWLQPVGAPTLAVKSLSVAGE